MENNTEVSQNIKNRTTYDLGILTPGYISKVKVKVVKSFPTL